jgi:hypothetical protein
MSNAAQARAAQSTPLQMWVPPVQKTEDFKGPYRLSKSRVNPRALAMTRNALCELLGDLGAAV